MHGGVADGRSLAEHEALDGRARLQDERRQFRRLAGPHGHLPAGGHEPPR